VLSEPGHNTPLQAVTGHCLACRYRMSWIVIRGRLRRDYRHIANKKAPNRALSGEQVAKATAEKVFGWKNVHNHEGTPTFTRQLDGLTIRT
jgi:hypothetical protein